MTEALLVETAAKGFFVLACACVAAALLRRAPAAVRAQVWMAAFAGLLALPVLTGLLPLRIPVASAWTPPAVIARATAAAMPAASSEAPSSVTARLPRRRPSIDWTRALTGAWLLGSALMLAVFACGCVVASRVKRRSIPFPVPDLPVDVRVTGAPGPPMQVGLLRPAILLPLDARDWPPERLRLVLLHEVAHIQRRDLAMQMIARIALALHWWNPLAWFAWRRLLQERERAADDAVVRAGAKPSEYASHLLEIARAMRSARTATLAAAAMARETNMELRFAALFDRKTDRRPATARHAFAAALATVCILVPLAAMKAQAPAKPFQKADEALARRDYNSARAAIDAEIAAMGTRSGPAYARALVKAADIERRRAKRPAATDLYKQALAAAGDVPETAPALLALGEWALADKHFDESVQFLERAERAAPSSAAQAVAWQALVRERQGDIQSADALYTRALALAAPESPDRATVISLYKRFLDSVGRAAEASQMVMPTMPRAVVRPAEGVYRMGPGITSPKLTHKEEPAYTDEARIAKLDGTVILGVEVGVDGQPHNVRVVRPLGLGLEENAVDAVSRWRFEPGMKNGQPVPVAATIEVNFRLM